MERWKPVIKHPNYAVSDQGRVKKRTTDKVLVATDDSRGYPSVTVLDDSGQHTKRVHRMVAETFIPNVDGKTTVNHKDGNKRNNHISNLEWNTMSENIQHAYDHDLKRRPDNAGSPKHPVMIVETGEVFDSLGDCARAIGGVTAHICNCLSGRYKTHCGYHFKSL